MSAEHMSAINVAVDTAADAAAAGTAAKVSLGGSGVFGAVSVVSYIESSGLGTLISLLFVAAGFVLTWHYNRKRYKLDSLLALEKDRREKEMHAARMRIIEAHAQAAYVSGGQRDER